MMYLGVQDLFYTFNLLDLQAKWAVLHMTGKIDLPDPEQMREEAEQDTEEENTYNT